MKSIGEPGAYLLSRGLGRFIPEPRNTLSTFGTMLRSVGGVLSTRGRGFPGIEPEYQTLLEKQIEVQQQMQVLSMQSNIEKSKHETQMTAIRNIRIS